MVTVGEILYILVMRERALRLSILGKISADILKYFSYFTRKTRFDISCKLSPLENMESEKNINKLSSAE